MLAAFPFLPKPCPLMMIMQGDRKCFNVISPSLRVSITSKAAFLPCLGSLSRLSVWIREQYGFATVHKVTYVPPVIIGSDRKGKFNFRGRYYICLYTFMHIMERLFLSVEEAPLRRSPAVIQENIQCNVMGKMPTFKCWICHY